MIRPLAAEANGPGFKIPIAHARLDICFSCHCVRRFGTVGSLSSSRGLGQSTFLTRSFGFNRVIALSLKLVVGFESDSSETL